MTNENDQALRRTVIDLANQFGLTYDEVVAILVDEALAARGITP